MQRMQHTHKHKAVIGRVEAKRLLVEGNQNIVADSSLYWCLIAWISVVAAKTGMYFFKRRLMILQISATSAALSSSVGIYLRLDFCLHRRSVLRFDSGWRSKRSCLPWLSSFQVLDACTPQIYSHYQMWRCVLYNESVNTTYVENITSWPVANPSRWSKMIVMSSWRQGDGVSIWATALCIPWKRYYTNADIKITIICIIHRNGHFILTVPLPVIQ